MPLWTDIYFKCPSCGGHLMVDRAAAGFSAPCPHCSASVRVPHRSGLPPKLSRGLALGGINLAVLLLITAGVLAALGPFEKTVPADAQPGAAAAKSPEKSKAPPAAVPQPAPQAGLAFVPEEDNRKLAQHAADLQARYDDLGNWILQNVRGKYPLPDRLVSSLRLPAVNDDYELHADVAEVLSVKPEEKALVNDALIATHDVIAQLVTASMTVTQTAPDKATVYIPAFTDSGAKAKEDLYAALSSALGEARFQRLLDMTEDQLQKQYHYFGDAQRTLVFEQAYVDGNPNDSFLVIKDGWIRPNGDSSRSYEVSETSVRELPRQYLGFLNVLPAYVAAFAKP